MKRIKKNNRKFLNTLIIIAIILLFPIGNYTIIYSYGIKNANEFVNIKGLKNKSNNFYEPYVFTASNYANVFNYIVGFITRADFIDNNKYEEEATALTDDPYANHGYNYNYFPYLNKENGKAIDVEDYYNRILVVDYAIPLYVVLKDNPDFVTLDYINFGYIDKNTTKTDLKTYDKVTKINGQKINSFNDYENITRTFLFNETINFELLNKEQKSMVFYSDGQSNSLQTPLFVFRINRDKIELKKEYNFFWRGTSGFLSYALNIYSQINNANLTKGQDIVVTGSLTEEGSVEAVSGIGHKIKAAVKNDIKYFMLPRVNYDYAKKYIKENKIDITLIPVSNFNEAVSSLTKIFG